MKVNVGNDLYLKGRIGWKGLSKDEYLDKSNYRIINGYSLKDGFIDWDIAGYISEDRYEESPEIKLKQNDILISKDGTIGKVGIVRNLVSPTTVASGIFVLRNIIEDKLDTEYLFQYLKSSNFKAFINAVKASGSTIIHLYQRDLAKLEIDVPQISIQKAISKILLSLDSKIELNNRINAELEAMAKTLYDYWFVQFDFPDENGKPYKTSGGKMVWNEELKREVPEGWEVKELQEIATCIMGQSPKGESYNQDGIGTPLLNGPADYENGALKGRTYTTDPTRLCQKNDLVLCIRATIGNLVYSEQEFCLGRGVAAVRSNKKRLSELIYYLLLQEIERFKVQATGSIIVGITKNDLIESKCLIPNEDLIDTFHHLVKPQFDKVRINKKENLKLTELRDWLLPMLMNGQVRVN
jgi:type I restriction enzyme S subunit